MDIVIGKHSFNAKSLRIVSKEKALQCFKHIDKAIVERAWNEANPKRAKRKSPKTNSKA